MAAATNNVAAKTPARTIMAQGAEASVVAVTDAFSGGGAGGTRRRFNGKPRIRCSAAQTAQAPRQPNSSVSSAVAGQPTVLAKPAISVIPVIAPRASLR